MLNNENGSVIGAGKDLALIGKNVSLIAAQDTIVEHGAQQSKSSGVSVGGTFNPRAAYKSAKAQSEQGNQTKSAVGKVLKRAEAIGEGLMAATTPVVVQASKRRANDIQEHTANDARVSTLQAGGDLTILATGGSIVSEGANMSAEGNATLIAKDSITLGLAHGAETRMQDSKAKGASFDNRGPLMVGSPASEIPPASVSAPSALKSPGQRCQPWEDQRWPARQSVCQASQSGQALRRRAASRPPAARASRPRDPGSGTRDTLIEVTSKVPN